MHTQLVAVKLVAACLALALGAQLSQAVITLQIGGATRLGSLSRQRDRYTCYWNCDLVSCQISHEDDECAYECDKTCRLRITDHDPFAAQARSGAAVAELTGKSSSAVDEQLHLKNSAAELPAELEAGSTVRLYLPRNASAKNFAIWERCSQDANTGKLTERAFQL